MYVAALIYIKWFNQETLTQCIYDDKVNLAYATELDDNQIVYSVNEECFSIQNGEDVDWEAIETKVFGTAPPKHLSQSWPIEAYGIVDGVRFELDETGRVTKRLKEEGIEFSLSF